MTRRLAIAALALMTSAPVAADPLIVAKSNRVIADGVNALGPKAIPGASVDYAIIVSNPLGNSLSTVGAVVVTDRLPAGVKLRVADLGAGGAGPVEFTDGALLGLGGSGLGYGFASLASASDGLEFSVDGIDFSYVPVADASGSDPRVRAVRIRLVGNQAAGSSFRLRFRVIVL